MAVATMPTNTYQLGTGRNSRNPIPAHAISATQGTPHLLIRWSPPGSSPLTDIEYAIRLPSPRLTQPAAAGESTASSSRTNENQAKPAALTASSSGDAAPLLSMSPAQSPGATPASCELSAPMKPICKHRYSVIGNSSPPADSRSRAFPAGAGIGSITRSSAPRPMPAPQHDPRARMSDRRRSCWRCRWPHESR